MNSRAKILVSAGPIPAKIDSVKYLTNRFKGKSILSVALHLQDKWNHEVDLIIWRHSGLDRHEITTRMRVLGTRIHLVDDVNEYYQVMKALSKEYSAFVLGAAVANLMPVETLNGKFPSHLYSEGEEFNIKFTIAPRIIDMIKRENTYCSLIGYKLYDGTHEELISAARKTLKDSRANGIFANRPNNIGTKYLVLPEGGTIEMGFEEHISWINKMITLKHFRAVESYRYSPEEARLGNEIPELICQHFEKYIRQEEFGSCAVRGDGCIVTTSRRHNGISFILDDTIDEDLEYLRLRYIGSKPSKNAPLLCAEMQNKHADIVHHRHIGGKGLPIEEFTFPGTEEERTSKEKGDYYIQHHGTIEKKKILPVDWNMYYEMFPERYFKIHPKIQGIYNKPLGSNVLDVGCNISYNADFWLDPYVSENWPGRVTYETLEKYDFITLSNSINYLEDEEIELLINALNPGGIMMANTFANAPVTKINENEIVYCSESVVTHILWDSKTEQYYRHTFFNRKPEFWKQLGFSIEKYNNGKSFFLRYKK